MSVHQRNNVDRKHQEQDRLKDEGYIGLAQPAMEVAEERARQLDEIERLLDAGEINDMIVVLREYLGSKKKRVMGVANVSGKKASA